MFKKVLKTIIAIPLIIVVILIIMINVKLHIQPEYKTFGRNAINYDLLLQLRGLKESLDRGADSDMQSIFPEGYVFFNAMYSIAWCNFLDDNIEQVFYDEGILEVRKACAKINSACGRSTFPEGLPLRNGAFYNGWSTYVLGRMLSIERRDSTHSDVLLFKGRCAEIAIAIQGTVYPESYYGSAWPADVMVCVAALSLHDKIYPSRYSHVIRDWVTKVRKQCAVSGSIPHSAHAKGARGSSQALMLIFLLEIDEAFAKDQFAIFKEVFVDEKFGLTGIREYPKGESGYGDIDSGPVLFGFGGAATIVGMRTLYIFGEKELASSVSGTIEAFALSTRNEREKNYFFGLMPMADAFIAWSYSGMRELPTPSYMRFHGYSLVMVLVMSLLFWRLIRRSR